MKSSNWTIGQDGGGGNYFLYNASTGKRMGNFKTRESASNFAKNMGSKAYEKGGKMSSNNQDFDVDDIPSLNEEIYNLTRAIRQYKNSTDAESKKRYKFLKEQQTYLKNELKRLEAMSSNDSKMAQGGMTEHGLKVGDKITSDKGDKIEIYNKKMREDGYVKLDTGDRRTHKYAKGGKTSGKAKFELLVYDVWGNEEDGFEVNNKFKTGKYIMLGENMTDKQIVKKLIDDGIFHTGLESKIDVDGEFEYVLYFTDNENSEPLCELHNVDMMAKGGKVNIIKDQLFSYWQNSEKDDPTFWLDGGEYNISEMVEMASDNFDYDENVIEQFATQYSQKMAKGGAIYKGDKVKIKGSKKSMTVKDIRKGDKGYIEFSGDKGTFLKGDLEKYDKGGNIGGYSIGGL